MKKILTATGDKKVNEKIGSLNNIIMVNQDIQYQEGIIEALDKYQDIDIIIIKDDIIGEMKIDDLIRSIVMLKNDIEIILITKEEAVSEYKNVVEIVQDNQEYVNYIINYLTDEIYIKKEKVTKNHEEEEDVKQESEKRKASEVTINEEIKQRRNYQFKDGLENIKKIFCKQKKIKIVLTVIGKAGVRKNDIYIDIIKAYKGQESINNRF